MLVSEYVISMLEALERLKRSVALAVDSFVAMDERPWFLPGVEDGVSGPAVLADSFRRLYKRSEPEARLVGIVCVSASVAEAFLTVNADKLAFRRAVLALKALDDGRDKKRTTSKTIERVLAAKGIRPEVFDKALLQAGVSRIDFNHVYKKWQVLPDNVQHIGFTWDRQHASIDRLMADDARALIEHTHNPVLQVVAEHRLAPLAKTEPLAYKRRKAPQLRANIISEDKLRPRYQIPVSGPLFWVGDALPRFQYRRLDEVRTGKPRTDRKIASEPLVSGMHLYPYLPGEKP